jgi:hypothetical protein
VHAEFSILTCNTGLDVLKVYRTKRKRVPVGGGDGASLVRSVYGLMDMYGAEDSDG